MLLQYATLDHLDRAAFQVEISVARDCEVLEPGYLRRMAESFGLDYDNAEHHRKEPA